MATGLQHIQLLMTRTMKWIRNTVKMGFAGDFCAFVVLPGVEVFFGGADGVGFPEQRQLYTYKSNWWLPLMCNATHTILCDGTHMGISCTSIQPSVLSENLSRLQVVRHRKSLTFLAKIYTANHRSRKRELYYRPSQNSASHCRACHFRARFMVLTISLCWWLRRRRSWRRRSLILIQCTTWIKIWILNSYQTLLSPLRFSKSIDYHLSIHLTIHLANFIQVISFWITTMET